MAGTDLVRPVNRTNQQNPYLFADPAASSAVSGLVQLMVQVSQPSVQLTEQPVCRVDYVGHTNIIQMSETASRRTQMGPDQMSTVGPVRLDILRPRVGVRDI